MGYINDGAVIEANTGFNMPTNAITLGDKFLPALRQLDITQNCNKYKWTGLPAHIPSWTLELMLYSRGSLAGFVYAGEFKVLPFESIGTLNEVGLFTKIRPMSYNGFVDNDGDSPLSADLEIPVYDGRPSNDEMRACVLLDNYPFINNSYKVFSRFVLNNEFVKWQADLLDRIGINIKNSTKRILIKVSDPKQKKQLELDLKAAYNTISPFIIYTDGAPLETDGTFLDIKDDLHAQDLIETWQSLNNIRCMISGIDNNGAFNKKERMITAEQTGNNQQTDVVYDSGLMFRKLWLDQLKAAYPDNEVIKGISVELNENNSYNIDIKDIKNDKDGQNE